MNKRIVIPGELIADKKLYISNTYIEDGRTYAAAIGTVDDEGRYISLENRYKPSTGDVVIGIVVDVRHIGYMIDLNLPQTGLVPSRDVRLKLQLGDFVICRVKLVNEVGDIDLGEVRRLPKGKVIEFPSAKIPRLIGRKSSMLNLLKENAGGDILVGNNGYVWLSDKSNIPLLLEAIEMIETKAHTSGLTDQMANFLQERMR